MKIDPCSCRSLPILSWWRRHNDADACKAVARASLCIALVAVIASAASGCATIKGYPTDPENDHTLLNELTPYFSPCWDKKYDTETHVAKKRALRNLIVLSRLRAYDIEFAAYEKSLWGTGNSVKLAGDLLALGLGGLATTVVSTSAKTGYAAAATGVVGANAAITKDLYYQRTLPALLSEMEADRNVVIARILKGLSQSIAAYPLALAEIDLDDLKVAGGMPAALGNITQQAGNKKKETQAILDKIRTGSFSMSTSSEQLRNWVTVNGATDKKRMSELQKWMQADAVDPVLHSIPPEILIDEKTPQLEADRLRAIAALKIK